MLLFGRWVQKLCRARARIPSPKPRRAGGETLNAVPTVQAFTQEAYERRAFGGTVERAFRYRHAAAPVARAVLTAVAIFTAFASLATVALVGAARH